MSRKITCPGCDLYLSSIFRAYADGRPCPHCGSSLQAASEQYYRQLPEAQEGPRRTAHDDLVELIDQHHYTLYDEDGLSCTCGDTDGDSYPEHLAKLIEALGR